jgi:hypothetical protein
MAEMFIRICDKEDDITQPCSSFNEKKTLLVIERPDKSVLILYRKDMVSPTKIYLMNSNGKTIDSRVYRAEELVEKLKED